MKSLNNLTLQVFRKYTLVGILGISLGFLLHLSIIWLDSKLMDSSKPIFLNTKESFWQSAFSFPFLPILVLEIFFSILTIGLFFQLKRALKIAHSKDIENTNYNATVKTLQKTMGLIAEHIATNNNKILQKIEFRRQQGQQTSQVIEEASKNISNILRIMSEVSFVEAYTKKEKNLLEELERRLKEINSNQKEKSNNL